MKMGFDRRPASSEDQGKHKVQRTILNPETRSPLLIVFPEDDDCFLYNPREDRIEKPGRDCSKFRFLASSGKWFLVVDPELNLSIIDLFSEKKMDLPPLESMDSRSAGACLERLEDKTMVETLFNFPSPPEPRTAQELRGLLWVNEDDLEYVVVWRFEISHYVGFCKNGYTHHLGTPTTSCLDGPSVQRRLQGVDDMVLSRDTLYIFTEHRLIRILSFSGQYGFTDDSHNRFPMNQPSLNIKQATKIITYGEKIAVTRLGQVFTVDTIVYEDATSARHRYFRLCKKDPTALNPFSKLVEVDSLGDCALFLDSGLILPADKALGIQPNSIYFTRDDRVRIRSEIRRCPSLDICVFDIATKTVKRFDIPSNLNIKEALWFLPS